MQELPFRQISSSLKVGLDSQRGIWKSKKQIPFSLFYLCLTQPLLLIELSEQEYSLGMEHTVYLESEGEYERVPIADLEGVLMVRVVSKSAGAWIKNGKYKRICNYEIEKIRTYRPELIQLVLSEDDPIIEHVQKTRARHIR